MHTQQRRSWGQFCAGVAAALLAAGLPFCIAPGRAGAPAPRVRWNVAELGAHGDGAADATVVFQGALDRAGQTGGGVVEVPAGRYRFEGTLSIPANVTLEGTHRAAPTPGPRTGSPPAGTTLLAIAGRGSDTGPAFIRLAGTNAALAGVTIDYPEWKQSDVPPVPYPPCIESRDTENVSVRDCCLLNPYEGIRLVRAARHLIRNVTGYPVRRGIHVDECYDIGRIENVHFWPFGVRYDPADPYCKWINLEGVAFELARTDWHYVLNTFCFGYGIGYRFARSPKGSANGNFIGLGADCCERAVVIEQAQAPGLLITNGEFVGRWSSTEAVCVEIGPETEGKVSLVNCSFWGPIDRCVWMRSPAGQFTASACHFVNWDAHGAGAPAIHLDAGRAILQGCTFARDNLHVLVGESVVSAIVTANQAPGGVRIENRAGARTQQSLNEADPIVWTPERRAHYRVTVGAPGDGRFLRGWHGPERSDRPMRWSMAESDLDLPVTPGARYTATLELHVPPQAIAPGTGLYFDGRLLAPLAPGPALNITVPPSTSDRVRLTLRVAGWIPSRLSPGSNDPRTLGVQLFTVRMRAEKAGPAVFEINPETAPPTPDRPGT